MAATLERAALNEWLSAFSGPGDALETENLPDCMCSEIQDQFSSLILSA